MQDLLSARKNLMIETTLTGKTYAQLISSWRFAGHLITIHYLRLPNVEASIARVRRRVASGGHDIPAPVLQRRFQRSLVNFQDIYRDIVDEWYLYDSVEGNFVLVGEGGKA
jgi:predicted ABC-type ATPase